MFRQNAWGGKITHMFIRKSDCNKIPRALYVDFFFSHEFQGKETNSLGVILSMLEVGGGGEIICGIQYMQREGRRGRKQFE